MQYILEEEFEDHIILSIEIENCGKFGLRVLKNQDEHFIIKHHKEQCKKAIARNIFKKHKIIVDDYVPTTSELLDRETLLSFFEGKLTEKDIIHYLTRNNTSNFFYLFSEDFKRLKNQYGT